MVLRDAFVAVLVVAGHAGHQLLAVTALDVIEEVGGTSPAQHGGALSVVADLDRTVGQLAVVKAFWSSWHIWRLSGLRDCRRTLYRQVMLSLDGDPNVSTPLCIVCGSDFVLIDHFILNNGSAWAISKTALHNHRGVREAWIDAILGTFGHDDASDHITFGARVGPVDGSPDPAATLVDAAEPYPESDMFGLKLSRAQGLDHARLSDFWQVVDFILVSDPQVQKHVYG